MEIENKQKTLHHAVSAIGGFMAGYTIFNHTEILANAQTGNLIKLIISAFTGNLFAVLFMLLSFFVYAAGNVFYAVGRRYLKISMKIVSLIVTSLAIPLTGLLCFSGNPFLSVLPIVFAMPIQWNAYKTAGGNSSSTVFSSNNVRQAVIQLTNCIMDRDERSKSAARFYWATLLCFHIGVTAACLLSLSFGKQSIWFCYVFIALAAAAYADYKR